MQVLPLIAILGLAGCIGVVRPSGDEVVVAVAEADGAFAEVSPWLLSTGYRPIDLGAMGGPRPDGPAICLEQARGNAMFGVDVVRVCADPADQVVGVWKMQTHSGAGWIRLM